eukprot:14140992-Alexandrium_andersonii.AAC.1
MRTAPQTAHLPARRFLRGRPHHRRGRVGVCRPGRRRSRGSGPADVAVGINGVGATGAAGAGPRPACG